MGVYSALSAVSLHSLAALTKPQRKWLSSQIFLISNTALLINYQLSKFSLVRVLLDIGGHMEHGKYIFPKDVVSPIFYYFELRTYENSSWWCLGSGILKHFSYCGSTHSSTHPPPPPATRLWEALCNFPGVVFFTPIICRVSQLWILLGRGLRRFGGGRVCMGGHRNVCGLTQNVCQGLTLC